MSVVLRGSWIVTVKVPFGSMRKIQVGGGTTLAAFAEAVFVSFGLVKDRAYFFSMSKTPWEGDIYTDSMEFPPEASSYSNKAGECFTDNCRFVLQLGYDPEYFFTCTAVWSAEKCIGPLLVASKGANASQFPVTEEDADDNTDNEENTQEVAVLPDEPYREPVYTEPEVITDRYLRAFVSLYGIISQKKAVELIHTYEPQLTPGEIKKAFEVLPREDRRADYSVAGTDIVYSELTESESGYIFELAALQQGKRYYVPSRGEMLKYADPLYFEKTASYTEGATMLSILTENGKKNAETVYRLIEGGYTEEEAVKVFMKTARLEDSSLTGAVARAVHLIAKDVRLWELRGKTRQTDTRE